VCIEEAGRGEKEKKKTNKYTLKKSLKIV